MTKLFALSILLISIFACSPTKNIDKPIINIPLTDKIIFLNFSIQKNKPNSIVKLENVTKVDGTLKKVKPSNNHFNNSLIVELYSQDRLINTVELDHPLLKRVEYLNDDNKFETKQLDLDKGEFFVRFHNLGENGKAIIYEKLMDKEKNKINTISF